MRYCRCTSELAGRLESQIHRIVSSEQLAKVIEDLTDQPPGQSLRHLRRSITHGCIMRSLPRALHQLRNRLQLLRPHRMTTPATAFESFSHPSSAPAPARSQQFPLNLHMNASPACHSIIRQQVRESLLLLSIRGPNCGQVRDSTCSL